MLGNMQCAEKNEKNLLGNQTDEVNESRGNSFVLMLWAALLTVTRLGFQLTLCQQTGCCVELLESWFDAGQVAKILLF